MRHTRFYLTLLMLLAGIILSTAQETSSFTPSITVMPQVISDDTISIDEVVAERFGIVAVYADDGTGELNGLLGFALLRPGITRDVRVQMQMINITPVLHVVLHLDTEPFGEFQYGQVEGADVPVMIDDERVMKTIEVPVISVHDQFVDPDNFNRIIVDTATISFESDAWVVAHNDSGEILGHTFLEEGTSQQIPVLLSGDVTSLIDITLHPDTGEREKFEYTDGAIVDMPFMIDGMIARTTIATSPTLRVDDQIVVGSDLTRNQNEQVPFLIDSVLSPVTGWLVARADDDGSPGHVIGFAPVNSGFNRNVNVPVTQVDITPRLFVTLHEDSGESQVFDFDPDAAIDLPVTVDDVALMASARVLPSLGAVIIDGDIIIIDDILMDTSGWVVATLPDDAVIGFAPLRPGLNRDVKLEIPDTATADILLRLHYDTRPPGIFSFESEPGSDLPVVFEGQPITTTVQLAND